MPKMGVKHHDHRDDDHDTDDETDDMDDNTLLMKKNRAMRRW